MKKSKTYPNIAQSFGITLIVVVGALLMGLAIFLEDLIGIDLASIICYIFGMGIPFWIIYKIRKNKCGEKKINLTIKNKRIIPIIIIATIALCFGITMPISELIPMSDSMKKMLLDVSDISEISSFIIAVIAAPIFEELIFRGIILDGLLKKYSPIKSILISSFLFGAFHLNPWQFVGAFILGSFSGWIYYKTQSLSLSIIIHAVANLSGLLVSSIIDTDLAMARNSLYVIIGSIVILIFCVHLLRKGFIKENINTVNTKNTLISNVV